MHLLHDIFELEYVDGEQDDHGVDDHHHPEQLLPNPPKAVAHLQLLVVVLALEFMETVND